MAEEAKKKVKRPTALKRDIRNEKRRQINKAFKSRVRTSIRNLETAIAKEDRTTIEKNLSEVYSMMDKGVKRGIFKLNKASRTKTRYTLRAQKAMK